MAQVTSQYYSHPQVRGAIRTAANLGMLGMCVAVPLIGKYAMGWRWHVRLLASTGAAVAVKGLGQLVERQVNASSVEVDIGERVLHAYERDESRPAERSVTGVHRWAASLFMRAVYPGVSLPKSTFEGSCTRLAIESPTCENGRSTILLNALLFKHDNPKGMAVISIANLTSADHCADLAKAWHVMGYDALIWDYPGYGHSEGAPNYDSCMAAARRVADVAKSWAGKRPLWFYGQSLGGPHAAEMARNHSPSKLTLDRTFATMEMAVSGTSRRWLAALAMRLFPYDTARTLGECDKVRTLIHWGTEDRLFGPEHAKALREASGGKAEVASTQASHSALEVPQLRLIFKDDIPT